MTAPSFVIVARDNPCAHSCRYCNMGKHRVTQVAWSRLNALIARFLDWQDEAGPEFALALAGGYSSESSQRESEDVVEETERLNRIMLDRRGVGAGRLHLGGLKMRPPAETRSWMQAQYAAGARFANASYAGVYEIHDYWNRRAGDFEHLLQLQRIAAETGMELGQNLFVTRSSFQHLERLLDHLDALPRPTTERAAILFSYIGSARSHEGERITEAHRECLPERVKSLIPERASWNSEREWVNNEPGDEPQGRPALWLFVEPENIDWLEATPCSEIVADLEARTRAACAALPSWGELRDRYGDRNGLLIYGSRNDVARKWLDRHLEEHPMVFERRLTHLRATF